MLLLLLVISGSSRTVGRYSEPVCICILYFLSYMLIVFLSFSSIHFWCIIYTFVCYIKYQRSFWYLTVSFDIYLINLGLCKVKLTDPSLNQIYSSLLLKVFKAVTHIAPTVARSAIPPWLFPMSLIDIQLHKEKHNNETSVLESLVVQKYIDLTYEVFFFI